MSSTHSHPPYPTSIDAHITNKDGSGHAYPVIGNLPTDVLVLADLHMALHLTEGPQT